MTVYRRPDPIPLRHGAPPRPSGASLAAIRAETEDLNRVAAREIFEAIAAGKFAAGAILPNEFELASDLGVSRTALREAIKGLAARGVVETRRKRGTQVLERSRWNMLDDELISWSRRDGSLRVSEELWSALIETQALLASEAAQSRRNTAIYEALRSFERTEDEARRRVAFCQLMIEIALAAGNRFLRSLTTSCVRSLVHDDPAFLDRQISRIQPQALSELVAAIGRGQAEVARTAAQRALRLTDAPAGA